MNRITPTLRPPCWMKSKTILRGLSMAVVLHFGVLAVSAQSTEYLATGAETNVTLNPGTYIITAYGAAGGPAMLANKFGGLGAEMSAEFNFSSPTDLALLVGNWGLLEPNESEQGISDAGGGGGGSFVVEGSTPLVVAGGGGGGAIYGLNGSAPNIADGGNASITSGGGTGGGNDGGSGGTGGSGGNGGGYLLFGGGVATDAFGAGGGGGFNTDGGYGNAIYDGVYPIGGSSFKGGGAGGSGAGLDGPNNGGFGGGGGAYTDANDAFGGGGGGYSGGGAGGVDLPPENFGAGGGGGSFIDSSAIAILAEISGVNSPDDGLKGEIIITAVPEPASATLLASGSLALLGRGRRRSRGESNKLGS
jgi:Glycine rich protein